MKKYAYKDSGIEWLGEIPEHWDWIKLKKIVSLTPSNVDKRTDDDETPVKLCNYVDVYYNDFIDLSLDFMEATANENELKRFQLQVGDVIITKDSEDPNDIAVPALVKETEEKLLCGYHLSILRIMSHRGHDEFLFWSLKDNYIISQLHREATGITRWAIGTKHVKKATIPLPPLPEQKAIADYLDAACQKIDRVIALKEEQIEKIDDFFKSRVYEIVKGIEERETVLKDSSHKILGEIPDSWDVVRLKHVLSKINSGVTPKGGATSYVDEGIPLVRSQNVKFDKLDLSNVVHIPESVHDGMSNSKLQQGDVLLNITGASLGRCFYYEKISEANVNQHVCILRPRYRITTKYLYYLLMCEIGQAQIFSGFTGSGREGLNFEAIKKFRIPLPDLDTQNVIVERLDGLFEKVRKQKELVSKQITTLTKYRKSLIHECVTGKRRVYEEEVQDVNVEAV